MGHAVQIISQLRWHIVCAMYICHMRMCGMFYGGDSAVVLYVCVVR